jgi:hypothetical protein
LDLTKVQWFGKDFSKAQPTYLLKYASTNGKNVYTDYIKYDNLNWPVMFGSSPKPCNAIICLFYINESGTLVGGKFDWWRVGGASVKGLENVYPKEVVQPDGTAIIEPGYSGHTGLPKNAECWEMIVSADGKFRSNVIKVVWK